MRIRVSIAAVCAAGLSVSIVHGAEPQGGAVCATHCEFVVNDFFAHCVTEEKPDTPCEDVATLGLQGCLDECQTALPPIDSALALAVASQEAAKLWGPVSVLEIQPVFGVDQNVASFLVILTRDPSVKNASSVRYEIAAGIDPVQWDSSICGVEVSASHEKPPVLGYWTGVPNEFVTMAYAEAAAEKSTGDSGFSIQRRFRAAAFPVLELVSEAGSVVYYDTMSRAVGKGLGLAPTPPKDSPEKAAIEAGQFRRSWARRVAQLTSK